MVLLAAVPAAAGTEPAFIAIRGIEYASRVGNAHVLDLYLPRRTRGRVPGGHLERRLRVAGRQRHPGCVGWPIQSCPLAVARANPATYASRDDPP